MGTYYTYNCQICGKTQNSKRRVRRCLLCNIQLCRKCQIKGCCPPHNDMLLPNEKGKLRTNQMLYRSACWIGLLAIFPAIALIIPLGEAGIALVFVIPIVVTILLCYVGNNGLKRTRDEVLQRLKAERALQ